MGELHTNAKNFNDRINTFNEHLIEQRKFIIEIRKEREDAPVVLDDKAVKMLEENKKNQASLLDMQARLAALSNKKGISTASTDDKSKQ